MKLYYFNPNTYGQQWFVMAESRGAAIEAVKAHIIADVAATHFYDDEPDENDKPNRVLQTADQKRATWLKAQLSYLDLYIDEDTPAWDPDAKPRRIEVYGPGEVIQSEIC